MDKYKKYAGTIIFILAVAVMLYAAISVIIPKYNEWVNLKNKVQTVTKQLEEKKQAQIRVAKKIKTIAKFYIVFTKENILPNGRKAGR